MPQVRSVMAAINRHRKEQIEMLGGKVSEGGGKKEINGTEAIEQRLKMLKNQTGKKIFDLREVL